MLEFRRRQFRFSTLPMTWVSPRKMSPPIAFPAQMNLNPSPLHRLRTFFLGLFLLSAPLSWAADAQLTASTLPSEARQTLALIQQGGPFPYARDGVVFGNFEKRLPLAARGYYHEYTVPTPGVKSRGARRLIAGGKPPSVFYYTDDHYQTFRRIEETRQ